MSQGLPGGYDSDVEGQPTQGNLQGFGEKAVRTKDTYSMKNKNRFEISLLEMMVSNF